MVELVPLELMHLPQHQVMVVQDRRVQYLEQQLHMPGVAAEAQKMAAATQVPEVQVAVLMECAVIISMVTQAQLILAAADLAVAVAQV